MSKRFRTDVGAAVACFYLLFLFSVILTTCSIRASQAGDSSIVPVPIPKSSSPMMIIRPNGLPIYVYPSQSQTGPVTVVTPNALPTYVYPSTSTYGPATIITPDAGPTYAWPGAQ